MSTIVLKLRKSRLTVHPIHWPTGLIYSDSQNVEVFSDHLSKFLEATTTSRLPDSEDDSNEAFEGFENVEGPILSANMGETQAIVSILKRQKPPSPTIRNCPTPIPDRLLAVVNATLSLQVLSDIWKISNVVVTPRRDKDALLPQNHRPSVILYCLRAELLVLRPLHGEKLGFRAGLSTDYQLFRVTDAIRDSLKCKEIIDTVFLVPSAFDTV